MANSSLPTPRTALVTGATGLTGRAVVDTLVASGRDVVALSRTPQPDRVGVRWFVADLKDVNSVRLALFETPIHELYHCAQKPPPRPIPLPTRALRVFTWMTAKMLPLLRRTPALEAGLYSGLGRFTGVRDAQQENLALLQHAIAGCGSSLQHVVAITGGRHYGMHLGPQLYADYESPYVEASTPRAPGPNWYYDVEDHLRTSTAPWTWTVLRPSFIVGGGGGGSHDLGAAIGAYVALCRAAAVPADFLGDRRTAAARLDLTSTKQLAAAAVWSANESAAANQAFNVATGRTFTWAALWPDLLEKFGLDGELTDAGVSLRSFTKRHSDRWAALAHREGLAHTEIGAFAAAEYADQMMILDWDAEFDVSALRRAGFSYFPEPLDVLVRTVREMAGANLIPPVGGAELSEAEQTAEVELAIALTTQRARSEYT